MNDEIRKHGLKEMDVTVLQALYELSLEACGGNENVLMEMAASGDEENMPKISEEELMKRVEEIWGRKNTGRE